MSRNIEEWNKIKGKNTVNSQKRFVFCILASERKRTEKGEWIPSEISSHKKGYPFHIYFYSTFFIFSYLCRPIRCVYQEFLSSCLHAIANRTTPLTLGSLILNFWWTCWNRMLFTLLAHETCRVFCSYFIIDLSSSLMRVMGIFEEISLVAPLTSLWLAWGG